MKRKKGVNLMGFINFLKNIFKPANHGNLINLYLKDNKCGEKIKLILRKSYDIQRIYEDSEEADYRLSKVVICNNCYNKINLKIDFDRRYNIINKEIDKGELITEEEFNNNN